MAADYSALLFKQYVGDGVTTDFEYPAEYIDATDIKATVNNVEVPLSAVDATTFRITPAPATDDAITLFRDSDVTAAKFSFPNRTNINNENLDGNSEQNIFLHQETRALANLIKHNREGTAAPSVTDDKDAGYTLGSTWIDHLTDTGYLCVDNTVGAAIWVPMGTASGTVNTVAGSHPIVVSGPATNPSVSLDSAWVATQLAAARDRTTHTGVQPSTTISDMSAFIRTLINDTNAQTARETLLIPRKNIIINGEFNLWRRGNTHVGVADGDYTADRWQWSQAGAGVVDIEYNPSDVPTQAQAGTKSNYSLLLTATTGDASMAASDLYLLGYKVEGWDYRQLEGNSATLSFWVKTANAGKYSIAFQSTGRDMSYVTSFTTTTTGWEYHTVTVDFDYTGGTWDYTTAIGLRILFIVAAGTNFETVTEDTWQSADYRVAQGQTNGIAANNDTFQLTRVQLEKGSVATEFEMRPLTKERTLTERYYRRYDLITFEPGITTNTHRKIISVLYDAPIRALPTITVRDSAGTPDRVSIYTNNSGAIASNHTAVINTINSNEGFRIGAQSGGTANAGFAAYDIEIDAEI